MTKINTTVLNAHNNKWNFEVVGAALIFSARVTKSSIYYCEYLIIINT